MKNLKFTTVIALLLLTIFASSKTFAELIFEDNFNITTSGDINHQLDDRQSGSMATLLWSWYSEAAGAMVTNVGEFAGNCILLPTCTLNPDFNFNNVDSGDVTIEFDLVRNANSDFFKIGFGKNWFYQDSESAPGTGIAIYPNGNYTVHTNNYMFTWQLKDELSYASNATLNIKIVISQGGFPPTEDAKAAIFINNQAYPLSGRDANPKLFTFKYEGGYTNNVITLCSPNSTNCIDNFKVYTPSANSFEANPWTGDADSGITNTKFYTHTVNFGTNGNVVVNDVTFTGTDTAMSGSDWKIKTAWLGDFGIFHPFYEWSVNPNVTNNSRYFLQDMYYDGGNSGGGGLSLSGLTPGLNYQITLFAQSYGGEGERNSYFATSDGASIKLQDMNVNGLDNGLRLTYKYTAPNSGEFGLSTTTTNLVPLAFPNHNWMWFAFCNELLPPNAPEAVTASKGTFSDKVQISWDAVSGVEYYSVFRADTNIFSSASEIQSGILTDFYDDSSVLVAKYYYWVKSGNTSGFSSATGPALGYKSSPTSPTKPTNSSPIEFAEVNASAVFSASDFDGTYVFAGSEWRVSQTDAGVAYWTSGETIADKSLTIPGNAIREGTNFWQVRYMNEYSTWSDWSDKTSFIYVPATQGPITFLDNFSVSGSGDANKDYSSTSRQSGNASPLTYKTEETTATGDGWLTLGQNSGVSPNYSFLGNSNFKIEFDVKPHNFDSSADWMSIAFGKVDNSSLSPISGSGFGTLIYANGTLKTYDSETLVGEITGIPTTEPLHVTITASSTDFQNEPLTFSTFLNNKPVVVDSTTLPAINMPLFAYTGSDGFDEENFITFFNNNEISTSLSAIDNFSITPAPDAVTTHPWTSDADSFIDENNDYTHSVNLNGGDVTVNNVTFDGGGFLSNIASGTDWEITASGVSLGFPNLTNKTDSFTSADSADLAKYFAFPHGSFAFNLSGLTPSSSNTMYIYTVGFDATAVREANFSSSYGGKIAKVDQNAYGEGGGLIVQYDYIADDETFSLVITPANLSPANTPCFHVSAFANIETAIPEPGIIISIFFSIFSIFYLRKK